MTTAQSQFRPAAGTVRPDPRLQELLRLGGGYYLGNLPGMAPKRKRPTPPGWEEFVRLCDEIT